MIGMDAMLKGRSFPVNVVPQFIMNEMSVEHVMSYLRDQNIPEQYCEAFKG